MNDAMPCIAYCCFLRNAAASLDQIRRPPLPAKQKPSLPAHPPSITTTTTNKVAMPHVPPSATSKQPQFQTLRPNKTTSATTGGTAAVGGGSNAMTMVAPKLRRSESNEVFYLFIYLSIHSFIHSFIYCYIYYTHISTIMVQLIERWFSVWFHSSPPFHSAPYVFPRSLSSFFLLTSNLNRKRLSIN